MKNEYKPFKEQYTEKHLQYIKSTYPRFLYLTNLNIGDYIVSTHCMTAPIYNFYNVNKILTIEYENSLEFPGIKTASDFYNIAPRTVFKGEPLKIVRIYGLPPKVEIIHSDGYVYQFLESEIEPEQTKLYNSGLTDKEDREIASDIINL